MATQIYQLTDTPVNLNGATDIDGNAITLTDGVTYSGRYNNRSALLRFVEADTGSAPTAGSRAALARPFEDLIIIPVAGEGIYVWTEDGTGQIAVNDT